MNIGEGISFSYILKSCFILFSPEVLPLFLILNRVIPVAKRNIEERPNVPRAGQDLLDANIRNHIHVSVFVNKSNNAVIVRILKLFTFRLKGTEINDLMSAKLRPVDLHLIFHLYCPLFEVVNIHDFLSAPLGLDFLRSPFCFI